MQPTPRCGSRIGDMVVDLGQLKQHFVGSISGHVDVFDQVCAPQPCFSLEQASIDHCTSLLSHARATGTHCPTTHHASAPVATLQL